MGLGISDFYNQALQRDFSRDFSMRVLKIGPGGFINEADNVYITTATLPGYAIANQQVPFMGMNFNIPGSGNFPGSEGWKVVFRCDAQLNIREKIIGWQKTVFNSFPSDDTNSTGAYSPKGRETIATLAVFDRTGNSVRAIDLIGCWPQAVGEIGYDATGSGKDMTLDVTLAYQWWNINTDFKGAVVGGSPI